MLFFMFLQIRLNKIKTKKLKKITDDGKSDAIEPWSQIGQYP